MIPTIYRSLIRPASENANQLVFVLDPADPLSVTAQQILWLDGNSGPVVYAPGIKCLQVEMPPNPGRAIEMGFAAIIVKAFASPPDPGGFPAQGGECDYWYPLIGNGQLQTDGQTFECTGDLAKPSPYAAWKLVGPMRNEVPG